MTSTQQNLTREQRLIELIKQITAENLIGDDCAVLPGKGLLSSDMLVEGKHFLLPQMKFEDLGWKCMAVNLSDIAAMGGKPKFALINVAMPARLTDEEFQRLYQSMQECASKFGTRIVGGDLTGSDLLVISITVLGQAHPKGALMRSGACVGDLVVVTGDFGASALGLELMLQGKADAPGAAYAVLRHCRPQPRLSEARLLAVLAAGQAACMDASDGLADALLQIAGASNVSIELEAETIPLDPRTVSSAAELGLDPLELALYGGEDYELVACVSSTVWKALSDQGSFKVIGKVVSGKGVIVNTESGPLPVDQKRTFQHWKT